MPHQALRYSVGIMGLKIYKVNNCGKNMDPFPNINNCIIFPGESKMKSIDETNGDINIRYSTF